MSNTLNILITGGTGFIGNNMVRRMVLDDNCFVKTTFHLSNPNLVHDRLQWINADLTNQEQCRNVCKDINCIFHCAAHTSGAKEMVENPESHIHINAIMNSHLLTAAAKAGVKKFVFMSSSALYPDIEIPVKESMAFTGDPPDVFFGPGWMKRYTEKLLEFYYTRCGMKAVIIRPSNIYGPHSSFDLDHSHVIPALIRKFVEGRDTIEIWGSPEVVRDFIYIDDFIDGLLLAFEKTSGIEAYNIASGQLQTIGHTVDLIKSITDYKGQIKYNSDKPMTVRKRIVCTEKAKSVLGFNATTTFHDGLRRTIEWYKENRN